MSNPVFIAALHVSYVEKTGAYTATNSDCVINATSGTFLITLPTAVGVAGRFYYIKNSGAGIITVTPAGAELVDVVATTTVTVGASLTVMSTNVGWIII